MATNADREQQVISNTKKLITILVNDLRSMEVYDRYLHGQHDLPYMPDTADEEYMLIAQRATMNWMPLLVDTPVQAMYVDGYEPGSNSNPGGAFGETHDQFEEQDNGFWNHWQRSRLDARQSAVYRGAFAYGHAFTVTERDPVTRKSETRGLSALKTSALFRDPANDIEPVAALHVEKWPTEIDAHKRELGEAIYWDDVAKYKIWFDNEQGDDDRNGIKVGFKLIEKHGNSSCPVTRFAATVDLEGRTIGLVGPMKLLQDRINQTVFDLLIAQTFGSFKVRWATGMAPPLKKRVIWLRDASGEIVRDSEGYPQVEDIVDQLDPSGRPIPEDINLNARRFMFAENPEVKYGAIDGTPLEGYIRSTELAVRQLAALSQTPPHHILGEIANLSAEALEAAETSLNRKIQLFKTTFGECWERVFYLASELDGNAAGMADYKGQVKWRDMEGSGFSKAADALLKLKEIEIPKRGLWRRVPGVTATELSEWEFLSKDDPSQIIASSMKAAREIEMKQQAEITPNSQAEDGDLIE